jgi:hypothetical protein
MLFCVLSANFFSSTSSLSRTSFWRAGGTVSSRRCDQEASSGCTALAVSCSAMAPPSDLTCSLRQLHGQRRLASF